MPTPRTRLGIYSGSATMKMDPQPHAVTGPRRTPLYFCFGCALMVLSVLLMPHYARELVDGDVGSSARTADQLPVPPTMNNVVDEKATMKEDSTTTAIEDDSSTTITPTNSNSTKPTLLLHLGPPKTSTTFLQCILTNMVETLLQDNYVYFGLHVWGCQRDIQYQPSWHGDPKFPFVEPKMATFKPEFIDELREYNRQGKNAIIINEGFWSYHTEQRKLVIDEFSENWNVKLVLNYRRAYELLPSGYNQNNKPLEGRSDYESLTQYWPGETSKDGTIIGKPLLHFNLEDEKVKHDIEDFENGVHSVGIVKNNYPFPDLTIIKLHEMDRTGKSGDVILQKLFCSQGIVDMPHSCAAVQLDETVAIGALAENPYCSFNYDMLATAAYTKQLYGFQKKKTAKESQQEEQSPPPTRGDIGKMIQAYQEETLNLTHSDFILTCLTQQEMDRILNATITTEKVIYGEDNWTSQHEMNLRQDFLKYKEKRGYVYCWINTEEVLQDPTWLAFLNGI